MLKKKRLKINLFDDTFTSYIQPIPVKRMYIRHVDRKCKCNTRSQAELFNYSSAQGYIVKNEVIF